MSRFQPPENFRFGNPVEWPDWKERFTRFRKATKLDKDDGEVQISALIYSMGKEAEHIFKSFVFANNDERKDYDVVMQKYDDYFVPKRNIIHERAKFHQRIQNSGETVETFVRNLHEIAEHCEFTDKNEQIRDRLVIGILDKELSEKLQLTSDLTLDKAIEISRQNELVKQQIKDQTAAHSIDAVQKPASKGNQRYRGRGRSNHGNHASSTSQDKTTGNNRCTRCNKFHDKGNCYAKGRYCRRCHKPNHFAVCCKSKQNNQRVDEVSPPDSLFLGSVTSCNDNTEAWKVNMNICGKTLTFKIDTGADTSVISYKTYQKLNQPAELEPISAPLFGPGGKLDCKGMFRVDTTYKSSKFSFPIHVINGSMSNNLLGRGTAEQMGMIRRIENVSVNKDLFGSYGLFKCDPVKIELKEGAQPYCLTTARRVAFPILKKVEAELTKLENEGIIEKVDKPTDWCAAMVPVVKPNNNVRICVDMKKLNNAVKRENYMLPNLDDIAPKLKGSTLFSKLDASSGFYQIPLDKDSCELTTFITPFGRYCFKRVPFGITSAPEIFQKKMTELLIGLKGVEVIIDDILVYGKTRKEHDEHLKAVLLRIYHSGLKLNYEKCEFRKTKLEYFGHIITPEGILPCERRIEAIRDMNAPTNIKELRRVVGMINYLGRFIPDLASVIKPMTDLLKTTNTWHWDCAQEQAFTKVKDLLTKSPVLTFYDQTKPIIVSADASSYGLGAALFQEENGEMKPIAYCSRKLTDTEQKYAQIEKECLAGVWACEKFSRYLLGLDSFRLLTDHKPLVPLINTQDLDKTPIRCQRMLMRLRGFNVQAEHVPGKFLVVPDTLSRSPLSRDQGYMVNEIECYSISVDMLRPISDRRLEEIRVSSKKDPLLQEAMNYTRFGWPVHVNSVRSELRDYFASRNELSISQGLLLYRDRIVVPSELRVEILNSIHEGHLGLNKCRARAQASVWWPNISKDIKGKLENCDFCKTNRPSQQKEPLKCTPLPSRPWQRVASDLCEMEGKHYLIVTDYYSRFLEIAYLSSLSSEQVIGKMKNFFARWGIPEELITDNGSQFTSHEFGNFAKKYGFRQIFSSPHYPQSNGEAESAVKTAKRILKQDDIFYALMAYRSAPIEATGMSPSEMIMGRKIRTNLPTLPETLKPKWDDDDAVRLKDAIYKERMKTNYDRHNAVRPLSELQEGSSVKLKTDKDKSWETSGTIKQSDPDTRSYIVQTPKGLYRRNRRHIQFSEQAGDLQSQEEQTNYGTTVNGETKSLDSSMSRLNPEQMQEKFTKFCSTSSPVVTTRSGRVVNKPLKYQDFVS